MAAVVVDDDEWEYEYSATETETIYVDLDLSSMNGVIKSKNAGDRKTLKKSQPQAHSALLKTGIYGDPNEIGEETQDPDQVNRGDDGMDDERNGPENNYTGSPTQPQSPQEPRLLDEDHTGRLQLLDFSTTNPIISYNGQIYSCKWHDMLGTTMFVTKHQEAPFHEPDLSTDDFDLIGTTSIKLVGHQAKIVPKTISKKRKIGQTDDDNDNDNDNDSVGVNKQAATEAYTAVAATANTSAASTASFSRYIPDGRSLGTIKRTNPRTNIEIKQQAQFLERLMEVKKARGEVDTVRTFVDQATVAADARQSRKQKRTEKEVEKQRRQQKEREDETEEQRLRREVDELNRRVVKGDNDALERLQEIYAEMEEAGDDEEDEDDDNGNGDGDDGGMTKS